MSNGCGALRIYWNHGSSIIILFIVTVKSTMHCRMQPFRMDGNCSLWAGRTWRVAAGWLTGPVFFWVRVFPALSYINSRESHYIPLLMEKIYITLQVLFFNAYLILQFYLFFKKKLNNKNIIFL